MPRVAMHVHCLVLAGPDARHFAQAQFAGDVDKLVAGQWQWNAWLDAQGRVRALMHLADTGDGRLLGLLRGGDAAQVCATLARFRLRERVAITTQDFDAAEEGAMAAATIALEPDGTLIGYGERSLRLLPRGGAIDPATANRWRLADIRAGWPTLPAGNPEFLPPALGLERLGAVAFDKGCYPGQEITARLHHRGGHKRGLFHLRGATGLEPESTIADAASGPVRVLDCAPCRDLNEALVTAPRSIQSKINILHDTYDVISSFDV